MEFNNSLREENVAELNSTTCKTVYSDLVLQALYEAKRIEFGQNLNTHSHTPHAVEDEEKNLEHYRNLL